MIRYVDRILEAKLTCHLCGVKQVELVIPVQLTGGALDIYQQSKSDTEKANVGLTKAALYKAFAMDTLAQCTNVLLLRHPGIKRTHCIL